MSTGSSNDVFLNLVPNVFACEVVLESLLVDCGSEDDEGGARLDSTRGNLALATEANELSRREFAGLSAESEIESPGHQIENDVSSRVRVCGDALVGCESKLDRSWLCLEEFDVGFVRRLVDGSDVRHGSR